MRNEFRELKQLLLRLPVERTGGGPPFGGAGAAAICSVQPAAVRPAALAPAALPQNAIETEPINGEAQQPWNNVNDMLRNTLQGAIMPAALPKTIEALLQEHEVTYKLEQYRHARKGQWEASKRTAYSRRLYVYNTIVLRASLMRNDHDMNFKKVAVSRQMDADMLRNTLSSVDKYIKWLKATDPTIKPRRGRRGV